MAQAPRGGQGGPLPTTTATTRRLDLEVVLVGTADGGASSALRRLHAAWTPHARGEVACVERGSGGVVCDYAPLDLPRLGACDARAHVSAAPAAEGGRAALRRLLADAHAVVFLADGRPEARERDLAAWRELDGLLSALEAPGKPTALLVATGSGETPSAAGRAEWHAALAAAAPRRAIRNGAPDGPGPADDVVACFEDAVLAAAQRAVEGSDAALDGAARDAYATALAQRRVAAASAAAPGAPRRVALPSAPHLSDGTGLNQALDVGRWLALRELDVRRLQRERALGRLLLEVGQTCLAATEVESLLRRVLGALTMNLDAVTGWVGLADGGGAWVVYDPLGIASDGRAFADTAEALSLGLAAGGVVPVGPESGALLPGGGAGGRGLLAPFPAGEGRRGWILLLGPPDRGLPDDAEAVLASAGAFVGLALGRLAALTRLRESHAALEERVGARTREIREEKAELEVRVRERTRELEAAKRSALEMERRLLDRERAEGVHRLAAGLAHELNNPIGAALANVDFALEALQRVEPAIPVVARSDAADAVTALEDARRDLRRVAASVTTLFGQAAAGRRAAVRTPLPGAVREALHAYGKAMPGLPAPDLAVRVPVACGIPPAECSRWLFRVLTTLAQAQAPARAVEIDRSPDGPRVRVTLAGDCAAAREALATLDQEMRRAGARLESASGTEGTVLDLVLPAAVGESAVRPASAVEAAR